MPGVLVAVVGMHSGVESTATWQENLQNLDTTVDRCLLAKVQRFQRHIDGLRGEIAG